MELELEVSPPEVAVGKHVDGDNFDDVRKSPIVELVEERPKRPRADEVDEEQERKKARQKANVRREVSWRGTDPRSLTVERKELGDLVSSGSSRQVLLEKADAIIKELKDVKTGVVTKDYEWLKKLRASRKRMETCILQCHSSDRQSFLDLEVKLALSKYVCKCPNAPT